MANFQLLNNVDHRDLKVIVDRSAELGDNLAYAVTFPSEFRSLQRHYPVFFIKHSQTGEFQAIAMLGVEQGENLFLDETGWDAAYLPLNVVRQPFLIGFQDKEDNGTLTREPVISVDMDHPRVNTERGEPVFLEHGGQSEFLQKMNSILNLLHEGMLRSKPFFDTLCELDLLESFVLDVRLDDGSEHRLTGFYTINEDVLRKLSGDQLAMLNGRGYLEAIYMAVASTANLPALLERKNRRQKARAGHALR